MKNRYKSFNLRNVGEKVLATALIFGGILLSSSNLSAQEEYCDVTFPSSIESITSVVFGDINNQTGANEGTSLEDFTHLSTAVIPGEVVPIEVKGNTNGSYTNKVVVFIDWNQDGEFDNTAGSNERYELTDLYGSSGVDDVVSEGSIQIPVDALTGETRMRVLKKFSTFADPCNSSGYGQGEDYTVNVVSPEGCLNVINKSVVGVGNYDVEIEWTPLELGDPYVDFNYELRTSGEAGSGSAGLVSSGTITATTIEIDDLIAGTEYYFYVQTNCGSEESDWGTALVFSTISYVPVELSGFNADVIANGVGPASSSITNDVDGVNFALVSEDFRASASGPAPTKFLPLDRQIYSGDKWFSLQDYSGNNSLRLSSSNPEETLVLATPIVATELYLLGVSGSGASQFSVEVTFSDESTEVVSGLELPDWFSLSGDIVASKVGRVNTTTNNLDDSGPHLYEVILELAESNQAKYIESIKVIRNPSSAGIVNILAASIVPGISDACDGEPTAGTVDGPDTFGNCMNQGFQIIMDGTTLAQGMTYSWQGRNAGSSDGWQEVGTTSNLDYPAGAFINDLEFRLIVTCENSGLSDTSEVITVTLNDVTECYCEPAAQNAGRHINNFSTQDAIENISNLESGFSSNGYGDFTSMKVTEEAGEMVNFQADIVGGTAGFRIWVDWNQDGVFDPVTEVAYQSTGYSSNHSGSFEILTSALAGETRMRIVSDWSSTTATVDPCETMFSNGEFEDYIIEIVHPDCVKPYDLTAVSVDDSSVELVWSTVVPTEGWNISWGEAGYDPEGNDAIGTATSPVNEYTISGLDSQTEYDIYVQADCGEDDGVSNWIKITITTECVATTIPYTLDFEESDLLYCTSTEVISGNEWQVVDQNGNGFDSKVLRYAYSFNEANSWFYTQGLELEAGIEYVMTYKYGANSTYYEEKLRIAYGTSTNASQMLDTIVVHDNIDFDEAKIDTVTFSVDSDGVYYIGFQAFSGSSQYNLFVDDIHIDFCELVSGIDGAVEVCALEGVVDLNSVITSEYTHGTWSYPENEDVVLGSNFDMTYLMADDYEVYYIVSNACTSDTTIATVSVYEASSAGVGQTITVCKNSPINLYDGISGNSDLGGVWYDYNGNVLENSQPISSNIPGSFNYTYIVSNGVCPADTAIIEVIVDPSCDGGVSVGTEEFVELSVYPNPATTVLNIDNPSSTSNLRLEMIDMNGRVVIVEENVLNNSSKATLDISGLERGIYTLRIYNEEGQRIFKVVKQ